MSVYRQIKDRFIMKNAWDDWSSYRSELTKLILASKTKNVMIVGSGRCNDISLERLAEMCDKVVLVDTDADGMNEALFVLPEGLRSRVEIRTASITGITEEAMDDFCEKMLLFARTAGRTLTAEAFRDYLMKCTYELMSERIRSEDELLEIIPEDSADTVICCGVCSQLFSMLSYFVRSLISSLEDVMIGDSSDMTGDSPDMTGAKDPAMYLSMSSVKDLEAAESELNTYIHRMNAELIPVINSAILKMARNTALFGNEYMPDSPVEGAHQCIYDLRARTVPKELHLKWDFNRSMGIAYDMLIQICEK